MSKHVFSKGLIKLNNLLVSYNIDTVHPITQYIILKPNSLVERIITLTQWFNCLKLSFKAFQKLWRFRKSYSHIHLAKRDCLNHWTGFGFYSQGVFMLLWVYILNHIHTGNRMWLLLTKFVIVHTSRTKVLLTRYSCKVMKLQNVHVYNNCTRSHKVMGGREGNFFF